MQESRGPGTRSLRPMSRTAEETGSDRKQIILREAARLFRENGYMATTLRQLADRAGIKGGSIYHHFGSKQEILFRIMDQTMDNLVDRLSNLIAAVDDPLKKLETAIGFHIRYHVGDADETNVTDVELRSLEPANYDIIVAKRKRYETIFRDIINDGTAGGRMQVPDSGLTCKAVIQMCTSVSLWFRPDGLLSLDEVIERYTDFICWGVLGNLQN